MVTRFLAALLVVSGVYLVTKSVGRDPLFVVREAKTETVTDFAEALPTSRLIERAGNENRDMSSTNNLAKPSDDSGSRPVTPEEKYKAYRACLQSNDPCPGFDNLTEQDYVLDVVNRMHSEMSRHLQLMIDEPLQIEAEDELLARQLLQDEFPAIQLIGLKMIELFPANEENLNVVSAAVGTTLDEEFITRGFSYLAKMKDLDFAKPDIKKALDAQIRFGISDAAATVAARAAFEFMNEENLGHFITLREELKPFPVRHRALSSALREYRRQHQNQM